MRLAGFALLICAPLAFAQPEEAEFSPWPFVHAKAAFVGGVNWQAVKNSEFARILQKDLPGKATAGGDMDFVDRLDAVYLSAPATSAESGPPKAGLIVLRGKFDLAKLRAMAGKEGGRTQRYNDVEMLSPQGEGPVVAVLDPMTLLAGDRVSVTAGIRSRYSASPDNALVARAKSAAVSGIWMVADVPPVAPDAAKKATPANMLAGLRSVALSINLQRSADLVLDLDADDAQHAGAFAALIQMGLSTQGMPASALKVTTSGNSARLLASITPEQVKAGLQQAAKSIGTTAGFDVGSIFNGTPGSSPKKKPAAAPEPPLPPEKNVIKIYGLDEGVREIPAGPRP